MRLTHIVDIGASGVDGQPPYQEMLNLKLAKLIGFEPQEEWLKPLQHAAGSQSTYLPDVVFDGNPRTMYRTRVPGMASLYRPKHATLNVFPDFERFGEVLGTADVPTKTLDSLIEEPIDFIKIDAQGSELAIMQSAPNAVDSAVAIMLEVPFVSLYEHQPSFGEIDVWMRSRGFIPHTFMAVKVWPIGMDYAAPRQLLEADIVYVRDFREPRSASPEQWLHLERLAEHVFKSPDLKRYAAGLSAMAAHQRSTREADIMEMIG